MRTRTCHGVNAQVINVEGGAADKVSRTSAKSSSIRGVGQSAQALDLNPLLVLDEGRGVIAVDWLIELD